MERTAIAFSVLRLFTCGPTQSAAPDSTSALENLTKPFVQSMHIRKNTCIKYIYLYSTHMLNLSSLWAFADHIQTNIAQALASQKQLNSPPVPQTKITQQWYICNQSQPLTRLQPLVSQHVTQLNHCITFLKFSFSNYLSMLAWISPNKLPAGDTLGKLSLSS